MGHVGSRVPTMTPGGRWWRTPLQKPWRYSLAFRQLRDASRIERSRVNPHIGHRAGAEAETVQAGTDIYGPHHRGPPCTIYKQGRAGRLAPCQSNMDLAIGRQWRATGFAKQVPQVAVSDLKSQQAAADEDAERNVAWLNGLGRVEPKHRRARAANRLLVRPPPAAHRSLPGFDLPGRGERNITPGRGSLKR